MHEVSFPAAEKILTDIENVFKRDKELRDFEILPVTVGENKSPVLHAEHTLGLQEWCVRHLYVHIYNKVTALKQQQRLRREDPNVLSRLLLGGVLLNPDCTLLWNIRREFVVMGRFDPLTELHINAITLSRRPKTAEAFVYRRWILNRIIGVPLEAVMSASLLDEELQVSLMAADRYANNYHAWNHRMWVMSHLSQSQDLFLNEWTFSEKWVSIHVSEHSGLQYRQFLLKQAMRYTGHTELCAKFQKALESFLLPLKHSDLSDVTLKDCDFSRHLYFLLHHFLENEDSCSLCPINCEQSSFILQVGFLAYELHLVTELIHLYPDHEALWCHRRFVLFSFNALAKKINCHVTEESDVTDGIPLPKAQKLSVLETDYREEFLWKLVVWHDQELFKECTLLPPDESYQSKLAHRHQKWMQTILLASSSSFETQGMS